MEEDLLSSEQFTEDDAKRICFSRKQGKFTAEVSKLIDTKVGRVKRYTWTSASIEQFFEGLLQHGKDFPKILEHMQAKQRSINSGLTKDQVRFFFYRTWHKVELMLTDPSSFLDKKIKGCHTTMDDTSFQVEGIDIACEDDAQLDSSLDETEEAAENMNVSPCKVADVSEVIGSNSQSNDPERPEYANLDLPCPYKADNRRRDTLIVHGVRHNLDLVALICYWKLKQKYPVGEHCFARKLSELVYLGTTTIPGRVKGKRRSQIKIPACGAFRGNSVGTFEKQVLPDSIQPVDTNSGTADRFDITCSNSCFLEPATITLELRPLTAKTWLKVQAFSFNPRIRLQISASERISSIVQFMNARLSFSDSSITIHVVSSESCDICTCKELNLMVMSSLSSNTDKANCLGISTDCLLSDIGVKLDCSSVIPLFYQFSAYKDKVNHTGDLLKLVSFLKSDKSTHMLQPLNNIARRYSSPTLKKYIRSLPKNKSPLSKYRSIKYQSPKKLKLQFDSKDTPGTDTKHQATSLPTPTAVITSMGAMKRTRKPKSKIICGNYMRHLVPKPLLFLPKNEPSPKAKEVPVSSSTVYSGHGKVSHVSSNEKEIDIEGDIQGAVVHNFLSEKQSGVGTNSDIFTSSDTVNELLQGLAYNNQDQDRTLLELTKETCDVLPTFSKVLDTSSSTLSEDLKLCNEEKLPQFTELPDNSCKLVLDEASTDFIAKFKELASRMEKQAS